MAIIPFIRPNGVDFWTVTSAAGQAIPSDSMDNEMNTLVNFVNTNIGSGGGGSGGVSATVVQALHTFIVGNVVHFDGINWVKAQAGSATTLGTHIVIAIVDINTVTVSTGGELILTIAEWDLVTGQVGGLTKGEFYFTSAVTPGNLTTTEPVDPNFSNPMIFATAITTAWVLNYRPLGGTVPTVGLTGLTRTFTVKSGNYTVLPTDDILYIDTTAGVVTVTLPLAATVTNKVFDIKWRAGTSIVNVAAVDLIDGQASRTINTVFNTLSLHSDGSTYARI